MNTIQIGRKPRKVQWKWKRKVESGVLISSDHKNGVWHTHKAWTKKKIKFGTKYTCDT
jgi:hypothetical protein